MFTSVYGKNVCMQNVDWNDFNVIGIQYNESVKYNNNH